MDAASNGLGFVNFGQAKPQVLSPSDSAPQPGRDGGGGACVAVLPLATYDARQLK